MVERLSIYPRYLQEADNWLDKAFTGTVLALSDADGLARTENWSPGRAEAIDNPIPKVNITPGFVRDRKLDIILDNALSGNLLNESDITRLFHARDGEFEIVVQAANELRKKVNGESVQYVVNRLSLIHI